MKRVRQEQRLDENQPLSVLTPADVATLPLDTTAVLVRELSDEMAEALRRLPSLVCLYHAGHSTITDRGLHSLAQLTTLELLDLEWSEKITDSGVMALTALPRLRWLDLGFCFKLTLEALNGLRKVNPNLKVEGFPGART